MDRCSHVTTLLLGLEDYITKPSSSVSCKLVPCTWNRGRQKQKTPKRVQELSYSSKKRKCIEVIRFDPRAPSTVQEGSHLRESLLWNIENNKMTDCMWFSILEHQYSDYYPDPVHVHFLEDIRQIFLQNLKVPCESNGAVLVTEQRSDQWYTERRVRITASDCYTVISLRSGGAISIF